MTASQTLSAPTPNWDVSLRPSNLPPEFTDAIQFDDEQATMAVDLLAGTSVEPTNIELRYIRPHQTLSHLSQDPFIIETDEDCTVTELSVVIPSRNVEELAEEVAAINELTIAGLQRVVDVRQHGEPLEFDANSIRRLSPQSRKALGKDIGRYSFIAAAGSGLAIYIENKLGVPLEYAAGGTLTYTAAISGVAALVMKEERDFLRGCDLSWRATTAKAKEEDHFAKAIQEVSGLLPIMTVKGTS